MPDYESMGIEKCSTESARELCLTDGFYFVFYAKVLQAPSDNIHFITFNVKHTTLFSLQKRYNYVITKIIGQNNTHTCKIHSKNETSFFHIGG